MTSSTLDLYDDNMMSSRQRVVNTEPPGWTPAGAAFTTFLMRVFPLNERLTAAGEALAKTGGQTLARWLVLERIHDEPATVADIARALGHARQGVQRLADALVDSGAARYDSNPRHRRASLLTITHDGVASLRTIQTAQRAWSDHVGKQLGRENLTRTADLLAEAERVVMRGLPESQ